MEEPLASSNFPDSQKEISELCKFLGVKPVSCGPSISVIISLVAFSMIAIFILSPSFESITGFGPVVGMISKVIILVLACGVLIAFNSH